MLSEQKQWQLDAQLNPWSSSQMNRRMKKADENRRLSCLLKYV